MFRIRVIPSASLSQNSRELAEVQRILRSSFSALPAEEIEDLPAKLDGSLADRFQATIGMAPLRYVTELRMRLASQWLTLERLPIEEVAQRLGYTSQAAFSRAFKRITGNTPGLSRKVRQAAVT